MGKQLPLFQTQYRVKVTVVASHEMDTATWEKASRNIVIPLEFQGLHRDHSVRRKFVTSIQKEKGKTAEVNFHDLIHLQHFQSTVQPFGTLQTRLQVLQCCAEVVILQ